MASARANPILAVIVLVVVVGVLFLFLALLFRRRRRDRDPIPAGRADARQEPGFGPPRSYFDDDDRDERDDGGRRGIPLKRSRPEAPRRRPERQGFRFTTVFFAFALGILVGVGAITFAKSDNPKGDGIRFVKTFAKRAIALVEDQMKSEAQDAAPRTKLADSEPARPAIVKSLDQVPQKTANQAPEPVQPRVVDTPVEERMEDYVRALSRQLPKRIDQVTSLVSAKSSDRTITLGYTISQSIPPAEASSFADAMRTQIEAKTCALSKASDMRDLNDRGIAFELIYTDQSGKQAARVFLGSNFCSQSG